MSLRHTPPLPYVEENPPNDNKPPDPGSPLLRKPTDQQTNTTDVKSPIIDETDKIETSRKI